MQNNNKKQPYLYLLFSLSAYIHCCFFLYTNYILYTYKLWFTSQHQSCIFVTPFSSVEEVNAAFCLFFIFLIIFSCTVKCDALNGSTVPESHQRNRALIKHWTKVTGWVCCSHTSQTIRRCSVQFEDCMSMARKIKMQGWRRSLK